MAAELSRQYIEEEYVRKERSTYELAEECETYPNKVRRAILKYGYTLRDKSKAQKRAIESGRHKHPTKGLKRPESTKVKISEGMAKVWQQMGDSQREQRVQAAKQQWDSMSDPEREYFKKQSAAAVRKAAEYGSKLEKYLYNNLKRLGYDVQFHVEHIVSREALQVDLFLPILRTAIEVDGPAHFLPIWGEASLAKHLVADNAKTGLLLSAGYVLIRIKNLTKSMSNIQERGVLTKVVALLESIKADFPSKDNRFIEIEVKNGE
jgi:very-short-patch-repair endonuclease